MNKLEIFMKKNSSLILSIVSSIGVVTTTVLAIKATPKAIKLLEEEKQKKSKIITKTIYANNQQYSKTETIYENLKPLDIIKITWKPYIPTCISMFSTLICIFGNTYLNYKIQTSLVSAYVVLDQTYKQYIEKTKELYGNNADKTIKQEIAKDNFKNSDYIHREDKKLFFEFQTCRYFESTMEEVIIAENKLNQELAASGKVSMNDFYRFLHLDPLPYADHIGWCDHGNYKEIEFNHEKMILEDDLECILINNDALSLDFEFAE